MAGGSQTSAASGAKPRLAATILLVRDDPFEVLLVKRSSAGSFPSCHVFPGGVVEPEDCAKHWRDLCRGGERLSEADRAFRIAGLRECWEETGVLCASVQPSKKETASQRLELGRWMQARGAVFDIDQFADFSHWVTPPAAPKRWDTRFLLARAPEYHYASSDGVETVDTQWVEPQRALEMADRGELNLLFSTRANLHLLAMSSNFDDALEAAKARPFFVVTPMAQRIKGQLFVSIPQEAGYPVSHGWIDPPPGS